MRKIKHIHWESKFSVHVDEIDAQHQKLYDITNRMVDIYNNNPEDCLNIIHELVEYAVIHFRTEERILIKCEYSAYEEQFRAHEKFYDKVDVLLRDLKNHKEGLSLDIVTFLIDWIYTHTTSMDLKIGEHVLICGYQQ